MDIGSLGWESSPGTTPWASPRSCSIRTAPVISQIPPVWTSWAHGWSDLGWGQGKKEAWEKGMCPAWTLASDISSGWLYPVNLYPTFSFSVFLASAFRKDMGSSFSTLTPGSHCCTWFWHFLFLSSCPSQNMCVITRPLWRKRLTGTETMNWCQSDSHEVRVLCMHPNVPAVTPLTR